MGATHTRSRRDERGATAVVFGLVATLLMGFGALAVDFGQAYAKKSLLQTDVDLAVLAAAAELTGPDVCNSEVVAKATEFLDSAANRVAGQYPVDLQNASRDDGYIECSGWKVRLWAPKAHVDYTLGRVISSSDGLDVQAYAAAQIKSARGGATLPFFAVQGCDRGPQSIRNPSGPVAPPTTVPPLTPTSSPTNNATFTISPTSVPTGTTSAQITLTGSNLNNVDKVTFTGAAGPPYHYEVAPTTATATTITVSVPTDVLDVEDVWWVRVKAGDRYSATATAQPFTVGDDKLFCDARNEGNFGTIEIPRSDTNNAGWLALNIIKGVEPSLALHPLPNGQCDGQPGSVVSSPGPVNGTNCVASETGLKVSATTDGLVTGAGGMPGRLDTGSTSNCSRSGDSSRTAATVKGKQLNDDLLTCFITNAAHISDLVDPASSSVGVQALSADIFSSPRFFWLPVLDTDPSTGKKYWPIIGFVPGFISDQDLSATRDAPGTVSPLDGIAGDSSGVAEVEVVLFSEAALPEFAPARGEETDYTGTGPKAIVLVE